MNLDDLKAFDKRTSEIGLKFKTPKDSDLDYIEQVKILKHISNIIPCLNCGNKSKLYVGAVCLEDQRTTLFCSECELRILIRLNFINKGNNQQIKGDQNERKQNS